MARDGRASPAGVELGRIAAIRPTRPLHRRRYRAPFSWQPIAPRRSTRCGRAARCGKNAPVNNSSIRLDFRISRRSALGTFGTLGALAGLGGGPALANPTEFRAWVRELRREALGRGISARTFDAAMAEVPRPVDRVLELDQRQPEQTLTFPEYLARVVTPQRIE